MKLIQTFGIFSSVALLALAGCWRSNDTPTPPAVVQYDAGPVLSVAIENGEVHITPDAKDSASQVALPEDVPVFPKSNISLAVRSPRGQFMEFTTPSPGYEVRAYFVEQLSANAWELTSEKNSNFTHELAASKAGRKLYVLIDAVEGGAQITLSHEDSEG